MSAGCRLDNCLGDGCCRGEAIEQRVVRSQQWLYVVKPEVDASALDWSVSQDAPLEYMRTLYDLMYLAFQTDSTRYITYMLSAMNGKYLAASPKR